MPRQRIEIPRVCEHCRGVFIVQLCRTRFRPARFCSRACLYAGRVKPLAVRFRERLGPTTETGCVLWGGATNTGGYGMIRRGYQQRMVLASRVAWEMARGPIPDGMCVLHDCPGGDNPLCVNVEHLFLGTQKDNAVDCSRKNRRSKAKLSAEAVRDIRRRCVAGVTQKALAAEYGVSRASVQMLIAGKTWKHVD